MSAAEGRLRLLHLVASLGRLEVAGSHELPLPALGDAEAEAAAAKELGAFVISGRIPRAAAVVLGAPRADVILRRIDTPPVAVRSLPELVGFEVERHLPGKREEYLAGWTLEGRGPEKGHRVLLGAVRREGVDRAAALLRRANLPPTSVQPEPLALAGVLRVAEPALGAALLVHLGAAGFGVDCVEGGTVRFSRSFAVEGGAWAESLAPAAGAETAEAQEGRGAAATALAEQIAARLAQPLFLEALPGGKLPEIRLVGPGANRARLLQRLAELLPVPVRVTSPWPQARWTDPPADLAPWVVPFALARLGAADGRGGIELAEERQEEVHRAPSLRLTAALAGVLAALLLAWGGTVLVRDRRQAARVDGEIRALKGRMTAVEELNARLQTQRAVAGYLRDTVEGRPRQAVILRELTTLVPDDTHLAEYSFRDGTVEVSGLSPGASRLLPILEGSPLFAGVEFSAPIVAQGGGLERFRIRMKLEAAGG